MKHTYKALILIIIMMFAASPALAWYDAVMGEIRDNETGELWQHGATVNVYDCADRDPITTGDVPSSPTPGYGQFNLTLDASFQEVNNLCIEIVINSVNGYDPGTRIIQIPNDSSVNGVTFNAGTIYTNSGPTAVVLSGFTASADSGEPWQVYTAVVSALALSSAGWLLIRRRSSAKVISR